MKITSLNEDLPELILLEPKRHFDDRGSFHESFNQRQYGEALGGVKFVQDNVSVSSKGVVRGLHFQEPNGQAKLVQVLNGAVFDVAVDVRAGSPTFGKWAGVFLSGTSAAQLFIPGGFAHGFVALTDNAVFQYKCSDYYNPASERSVLWNDPDIGIKWPDHLLNQQVSMLNPQVPLLLSPKDAAAPRLRDILGRLLPAYSTKP